MNETINISEVISTLEENETKTDKIYGVFGLTKERMRSLVENMDAVRILGETPTHTTMICEILKYIRENAKTSQEAVCLLHHSLKTYFTSAMRADMMHGLFSGLRGEH